MQLSQKQRGEATEELAKVFQIAKDGVPVDVFSKAVDSVWHEMLEDEATYVEFCYKTVGVVIGHKESKGSGRVGFIKAYERRFGRLPDIWFTDATGRLIETQYGEYRDTGSVSASWNCRPTHGCDVLAPRDKPGQAPQEPEKPEKPAEPRRS